jgi:hypothetical protein
MIGINNEVEMRFKKRWDMDILSCCQALRYETYRSYNTVNIIYTTMNFISSNIILFMQNPHGMQNFELVWQCNRTISRKTYYYA